MRLKAIREILVISWLAKAINTVVKADRTEIISK